MGQNFASSFAEALPGGIQLAGEMREQGKSKAAKEAGQYLAEIQSYDPLALRDDPTAQGMPEPGQTAVANPNQGFDGNHVHDLSRKYFEAAAKMGDIREFAAASQVYGQMRAERITDYVKQGVASYDAGDMNGAARSLRGASAFMSPGTTPEITVDPNSGAFVVANYENGKPSSGYAITRDQLVNMIPLSPEAFAQLDNNKQEHKEEMKVRYAQLAINQRSANARTALAQSAAETKAKKDALDIAGMELNNKIKGLEYDRDLATNPSTIGKTIAENEGAIATAPSTTAKDIAENEEKTRVARETEEKEYMKALLGEGNVNDDGLVGENLRYPLFDSTPSAPGGSTAGAAIPPDGSQDTGNNTLTQQYQTQGMPIVNIGTGSEKYALDPSMYRQDDGGRPV
jgi:hypothetical protein